MLAVLASFIWAYYVQNWCTYVCGCMIWDITGCLTTVIECCRSVAVSLVFLHLAALGRLLSIELANALNCRYRVCLYMASAVHLMYVSMYVAYVWLSVGKYLCISNSVCGMYCKDVCTYVLCCVCPVQDMTLVHTGSITACIGSSQKFTWHRWPWMMMLIDKIIVCLYVGLAICECLVRHTFLST